MPLAAQTGGRDDSGTTPTAEVVAGPTAVLVGTRAVDDGAKLEPTGDGNGDGGGEHRANPATASCTRKLITVTNASPSTMQLFQVVFGRGTNNALPWTRVSG